MLRSLNRLQQAIAFAAPSVLASLAAANLRAQASPTIPRFELGASPIELRGTARPGVYLASPGRRAIAMGTEDGRFELWSWPLKWLHDLELKFKVPKYTEPIPARDVARWVTVRPEGVTIDYAYETFRVRQHVFSTLDDPAVVMLLEVDAIRPMEIIATFRPDIHYAWPASLGGQYVAWNPSAKAFLFSESRRQVNAFLGSPAVTRASDVPAHMLASAPPQFVIGVGEEGQRYTEPKLGEPPGGNVNISQAYIPIVMAGGEMPRDSARALYDRLLSDGTIEGEWKKRVAHARAIQSNTMSVWTPDTLLNKAVEWAKVNLDDSMVCNPDLGCGLVAGYGLSGSASDRPGFGWFFGGDASINSLGMSAAGQRDLVREGVFRFFARYQRADGKITHEISQGAGKIDWFGAYPYAFYHGDTTPFWILAFGEYWKQTADTALVRELWPNLRKAYSWSKAADSDGDGLMENPIAGAGALEVGDLQIGIVSDVYLSGVWVAALERFARMADAMGEAQLGDEARRIRSRAQATLEAKLWMPAQQQYAFALLEGGQVNENLTSWPATAMSFDVFDPVKGAAMAARLAGSSIMTDWGARPLASSSRLFDPLHYNNGAVWPFVSGWVALAQYRYHNAHAGYFALRGIVRTGFDESLGRNPEVISGRIYRSLDTSVPHQFFATSMVLTPLIRGLLGVEVDAPAGVVTIAPHLPPDWDSVRVENVSVGSTRLAFSLKRNGRSLVLHASSTNGTPVVVRFRPALPLGATGVSVSTGTVSAEQRQGAIIASTEFTVRENAERRISWSGGWEARPPKDAAVIGERSHALRITSERVESGRYQVTVQGLAGKRYELAVRGPQGFSGEVLVRGGEGTAASRLRASAPDVWGWHNLQLTFPGDGADDDGYVELALVMQ